MNKILYTSFCIQLLHASLRKWENEVQLQIYGGTFKAVIEQSLSNCSEKQPGLEITLNNNSLFFSNNSLVPRLVWMAQELGKVNVSKTEKNEFFAQKLFF